MPEYIYLANTTLENIVLQCGSDTIVVGVAGKDDDDGVLALEDNGFVEAYSDVFGQAFEAEALVSVTEEEYEAIVTASQQAKSIYKVDGPKLVLKKPLSPTPAPKPKLATKSPASAPPKGNKQKNMEHYMKELNSLDNEIKGIEVSNLRSG